MSSTEEASTEQKKNSFEELQNLCRRIVNCLQNGTFATKFFFLKRGDEKNKYVYNFFFFFLLFFAWHGEQKKKKSKKYIKKDYQNEEYEYIKQHLLQNACVTLMKRGHVLRHFFFPFSLLHSPLPLFFFFFLVSLLTLALFFLGFFPFVPFFSPSFPALLYFHHFNNLFTYYCCFFCPLDKVERKHITRAIKNYDIVDDVEKSARLFIRIATPMLEDDSDMGREMLYHLLSADMPFYRNYGTHWVHFFFFCTGICIEDIQTPLHMKTTFQYTQRKGVPLTQEQVKEYEGFRKKITENVMLEYFHENRWK
ncbi:hypothetical protein RFI_15572, partial [Reticulomyxa filosa]